MVSLFINCSNHPSSGWSKEQREAAGEHNGLCWITDVQFPDVPPNASEAELDELARKLVNKIETIAHFDGVGDTYILHLQGESTLVYRVAKAIGQFRPVVASTTERRVQEEVLPDGSVRKQTIFKFVGFRKYETRQYPFKDVENGVVIMR